MPTIASNLSFLQNSSGAVTTGTINSLGAPITLSIAGSEANRVDGNLYSLLGYTTSQGAYKLQVNGNTLINGSLVVNTATITNLVGSVTTASSLASGTAGQIHYQVSPGVTAFAGPGTAGQLLMSAGTSAPTYTNTASIGVGFVSNALTIGTGLSGTSYNGSSAVTIANSGVTSNVAGTGIGVSAATGAVTITNNGVTSNVAGTGVSVSGATGAVTISIGQAVATSSNVQFNSLGVNTAGSGTAGEIRATNEITAYYSDRRLKENVKVIDNAVEKVLLLNGITYTPNELAESFGYDRTTKLVGLFADEVEVVLPEATRPAPFDQDENGNSKSGENYKTIQYEKVVPLLVEAIKEQQRQIAQLQEVINTLATK